MNTGPARAVRDAALASGAMTVSQLLEMHATGRPPSDVPVLTIERVVGANVPPGFPRVIVGYAAQGALALAAVLIAPKMRSFGSRPTRAVLGGAALVGADAAVSSALGAAAPPWRWTWREAATDLTHKTVLMAAADALAS